MLSRWKDEDWEEEKKLSSSFGGVVGLRSLAVVRGQLRERSIRT